MGSNCRTRGPGVKRNLSVTGFGGRVEPQCVDCRQQGSNPGASVRESAMQVDKIIFGHGLSRVPTDTLTESTAFSRCLPLHHAGKHSFQVLPRTFRYFGGLSDLILGGFHFRADPNSNAGTTEEGKNESTARGSRRPDCVQDQALEDYRTQSFGVRRIFGQSGSEELLATLRSIS